MPIVDFSQFFYYPALLCGIGEHLGYRQLPTADKRSTTPILELSHRAGFVNLETAVNEILITSDNRPFILDLSHESAPPPYVPREPTDDDRQRIAREAEAQASYNQLLANLLNPTNGFAEWREMVGRFPNAIPTIQYTDARAQSGNILRQVVLLSQRGNCVAIRISQRYGLDICGVIPQILSILESPDRLLIVVDCDQRRINISERANFASDAISRIGNDVDLQSRPLIEPSV